MTQYGGNSVNLKLSLVGITHLRYKGQDRGPQALPLHPQRGNLIGSRV